MDWVTSSVKKWSYKKVGIKKSVWKSRYQEKCWYKNELVSREDGLKNVGNKKVGIKKSVSNKIDIKTVGI